LDVKTPIGFQEEEPVVLEQKRTYRLISTEKTVSCRFLVVLFEELTFLLGKGGITID
jgi:hypothetical protein